MYSNVKNNLGSSRLSPLDQRPPRGDSPIRRLTRGGRAVTLYDTALARTQFGRERSVTPLLTRAHRPIKNIRSNGATVTLYDTALTLSMYGQPALGDLFNDIAGAIIPGWDQRPDWMKKIRLKPDPAKIIDTAVKAKPELAAKVIGTAEKAGVNVFYQTPSGPVQITPGMAQAGWSNLPMFARAAETPMWVWIAGGGAVLLLIVGMTARRR